MQIGVYTFADIGFENGQSTITPVQRMSNLLEEIRLADEVGLDVFGLGEHHRPDYLASSPAVILGAAAVITKQIRLSSAVTVLSSDDPVRVFQQFAEIDLLSKGRAEIMAGRGSFIESFPLFGYDLQAYDELFTEKLEMLLRINEGEMLTWKGTHTQTVTQRGVYPRPYQQKIPVWIGVGGTPESVVRAAEHGLPMALAIIGGLPARFAPYADLYRKVFFSKGFNENDLQLSINSHCYVADGSDQARNEFYPSYSGVMNRIGRERGWPPGTRDQFEASTELHGALLVGSPQEVIEKILYQHELFHHTRFLAQMSLGAMPHDKIMRSLELLGTIVAPAIRKAIPGIQQPIETSPNQPHDEKQDGSV
jgi:probable LLM family oxidoreductase